MNSDAAGPGILISPRQKHGPQPTKLTGNSDHVCDTVTNADHVPRKDAWVNNDHTAKPRRANSKIDRPTHRRRRRRGKPVLPPLRRHRTRLRPGPADRDGGPIRTGAEPERDLRPAGAARAARRSLQPEDVLTFHLHDPVLRDLRAPTPLQRGFRIPPTSSRHSEVFGPGRHCSPLTAAANFPARRAFRGLQIPTAQQRSTVK